MQIQKAKKIGLVCIFFVLLGGAAMEVVDNIPKKYPQSPAGSIKVNIEKVQHEKFFQLLQKFAEENGFSFRVVPVRPEGEHVKAEMFRDDLFIIVLNPFEPEEFKIGIYNLEDREISSVDIDILIEKIKSFIGDVVTLPKD